MTSMDEVGAELFAKIIRELSAEGVTIVWIAHDLTQVTQMAANVSCLNRTLLFSGPPADVLVGHETEVLFSRAGASAPSEAAS